MVRLVRVTEGIPYSNCKVETTNPGGSVKDRPALAMIEEAEKASSSLGQLLSSQRQEIQASV